MRLIKPSYTILSKVEGVEMLKSIERAGRTCYKSEDKITDESAEKFIEMLIKRGHESVLEHEKISILFVCDRGVSHEIVRHRLASFSQESTRYCNYSKDKFDNQLTFIIPNWLTEQPSFHIHSPIKPGLYLKSNIISVGNAEGGQEPNLFHNKFYEEDAQVWLDTMFSLEAIYNNLIKLGWQPQQARSVLPNSLKTEIVVTANIREWRTIFKQRTAVAAHPQMRELMCPLLDELKTIIPVVFNDINY